ncbi:hypothetical protein [Haloplanus pelagicus]|jgi:hypothetical protein|uniref:hypothetical protein n=1 Tax=Haloplanus pelagicus TaxID=2949995 RepID=UPI0020422609|nr:hypothetical protein [Haloplanus sp. HW8-1]
MSTTTVQRIHDLLDAVLQETTDEEARFKLRTAIQLLEAIEENHGRANEVLDDLELAPETRDRLLELGYLE